MFELAAFIILTIIVPMLVNKSTESGRFDWIMPHLRKIWTAVFAFFSIYLLQKEGVMRMVMELHKRWNENPALGYLVSAIMGALLLCGYWWFAGKVFSESQQQSLGLFAMTANVEYPLGTSIGGILWSPRFAELKVSIANETSRDYGDIDLTLKPDEPITAVGQSTNVPNVLLSTAADLTMRLEFIEGETGKRNIIPLVLIASTAGYRVQCPILRRKSRIEIVMAIAQVRDFPIGSKPPPKPDFGVYDRDYVLKIDKENGTAHWFGHGADANGRIDDVYKSERPTPKIVQVEGQYMVGQQEHTISERLVVHDLIREALPEIKKQVMEKKTN